MQSLVSDPPNSMPVPTHALLPLLIYLVVYAEAVLVPRAPFGWPCWKPLENLRETSLSERMRPLPVVFLRLAFSPQLSVESALVLVRELWSFSMFVWVRALLPGDAMMAAVKWNRDHVHFLMLALGYPQLEQVFFCTCMERRPVYHSLNQHLSIGCCALVHSIF